MVGAIAMILAGTRVTAQQTWNDARTTALVERATERRASQLADTALVDYKATAHGYVTFLAQFGEGFPEPPKIVKADELGLEVYWRAPDLSKQRIMGRRDTLLLPTDINYHRDHLGIVQNNFRNIIRIGEGDEVRDVPHPLSPLGLQVYDFAIHDSLQIRLADRVLDVYEVRVRPKDDRQPRTVGAVYIDRGTGEVVRMAFSFTRAALMDKELEDVSVVLENALIEGRFWLPRRQEIEIRRTGSWLDYPARGIIRGRWEICCYQVNTGIPVTFFGGPEIVMAPTAARLANPFPFSGHVLDSLPPDVRAVTDADVKKVQDEARALVREAALARTRSFAFSARHISDLARFNRVEGLAVGSGILQAALPDDMKLVRSASAVVWLSPLPAATVLVIDSRRAAAPSSIVPARGHGSCLRPNGNTVMSAMNRRHRSFATRSPPRNLAATTQIHTMFAPFH